MPAPMIVSFTWTKRNKKKEHITQDQCHHKSPHLKMSATLVMIPFINHHSSDIAVKRRCSQLPCSIIVAQEVPVKCLEHRPITFNIDDFPSNKPTLIWGTSQHISLPGHGWLMIIPMIFQFFQYRYYGGFWWYPESSITKIFEIEIDIQLLGIPNDMSVLSAYFETPRHTIAAQGLVQPCTGEDCLAMLAAVILVIIYRYTYTHMHPYIHYIALH